MDRIDLRNSLYGFTGSEQMYRHALNRNVIYTEGVQFFAENAGNGAYWLLDILATEPAILAQQKEFAAVVLSVKDGGATLTVTDGNKGPPVFSREISFTDCPEGVWKFYMIDGVILLPSEY
jgi:hypothetical protein